MRLSAVLAVLAPATLFAQTLPAPDPQLARQLDNYTAQAVRDWRAAGLAIAVVKDGRVVFAKGYGVREVGKPAQVDSQTLFAIGSTTKAMTAAAIGMLVDEGKLRWDDPVTQHLPTFQLADPYVTREITIRDLLTHRAGLGNADVLWYGTDADGAEILRRARFIPSAYSMRAGFIYQNVMYGIAGQVIGAVSGMTWAEFLKKRIFEPLGMTRTVPTLVEASRQDNVAAPHYLSGDSNRVVRNASVDGVASAGAVWSSVADMSKWMQFILDTGRVGNRHLLKPTTALELLKPQAMMPASEYPTSDLTRPHWNTYGLGWFQNDYTGRMLDFHTGSIDGMVAIIGLIPDERLGVYVLANTDHVEVRHALMYKALDLYLGNPPRDWSGEFRTLYARLGARGDSATRRVEAMRVADTKPSVALSKYAGTYAEPLVGTVTITEESGKLRFRMGAKRTGTLEHWQFDTFRVRWDDWWQGASAVTFAIGAGGVPDRMDFGGRTLRRR